MNEADLSARHLWLVNNTEFQERMKTDPEYFDTKVAGWWVWGQSQWIGAGWCTGRSSWGHEFADGSPCHERLPDISNPGKGVHRQRPHLGPGSYGSGYKSGIWTIEDGGAAHTQLCKYLEELAARLRRVRVCCGDWSRVVGPSPTFKLGLTGVFLDPPYADEADRQEGIYRQDSGSIAHDVREWALANGDNPLLRIALCGYEGEHQMPDAWECVAWKASGGYGSQGNGRGRQNAGRERIWFSPHCLMPQARLF